MYTDIPALESRYSLKPAGGSKGGVGVGARTSAVGEGKIGLGCSSVGVSGIELVSSGESVGGTGLGCSSVGVAEMLGLHDWMNNPANKRP